MSSTTHFDKKALEWDKSPEKQKRAKIFAKEIINNIPHSKKLKTLEFGCGTGLLSFELKNYFNEIILVDNSKGMITILKEKIKNNSIKNFKPYCLNLLENYSKFPKVDIIYTLMTLHHIENLEELFKVFKLILNKNGYLCIADLVEEDGSFHPKEQKFRGHNGFNKNQLIELLKKHSFIKEYYTICYEIEKNNTKYPLFLLIAKAI